MNLVALLIVPVVIKDLTPLVRYGAAGFAALMILVAVLFNRSGAIRKR